MVSALGYEEKNYGRRRRRRRYVYITDCPPGGHGGALRGWTSLFTSEKDDLTLFFPIVSVLGSLFLSSLEASKREVLSIFEPSILEVQKEFLTSSIRG